VEITSATIAFATDAAVAVFLTFSSIFVASLVAWQRNSAWQRKQLSKERKDAD
jgi:hypothetical protein